MWYAGIDWADPQQEVVVLDAAGTRVGHRRVAHTAEGVEPLVAWLRAVVVQDTPPGRARRPISSRWPASSRPAAGC